MVYRVYNWENEKVLGMDGGDGCSTIGVYKIPQSYTLKNNSDVKFYDMCVLSQV
jgi:hypothetical protein